MLQIFFSVNYLSNLLLTRGIMEEIIKFVAGESLVEEIILVDEIIDDPVF